MPSALVFSAARKNGMQWRSFNQAGNKAAVLHCNAIFGKKMRAGADQRCLKAKNRIAASISCVDHFAPVPPACGTSPSWRIVLSAFQRLRLATLRVRFCFFARLLRADFGFCLGAFAFLFFGASGGFIFLFARHERTILPHENFLLF